MKKKLPVGIEDFREIRTQEFYYVDKTGIIGDLMENLGKVNLFTRPRRFGKTLNMSMLKYFFETGSDGTLFDGLEIAKEKALCERYMGKFPVISVTLKGAVGRTYDEAKRMLRNIIGNEVMRFQFLLQSDGLTELVIPNREVRWIFVEQIREKGYESMLAENGMRTIYRYGIACYKKRCKVVSEGLRIEE